MAENICIMLTDIPHSEDGKAIVLRRAPGLVVAAVDQQKRAVIYVDGGWACIAEPGYLEKFSKTWRSFPYMDLFRHFQHGGGQLWVPVDDASHFAKDPPIQGTYFVDEKMLLTFLMQDTLVLF